jgi:predicted membrane protein
MMKKQKIMGLIIYILSVGILVYFYYSPHILIPAGYELAIDGYVLSKNVLLFLIFMLFAQFGLILFKQSLK